MNKANPYPLEDIIRALTVYSSVTTADGAGGLTLVDSTLNGENDFITDQCTVLITGDPSDLSSLEKRGATGFNPAAPATITVDSAFTGNIVAGTSYKLLNTASMHALMAILNAILTAVTGEASFHVWQSEAGPVEQNAFQMFNISLIDTDSGAITAANIDITGISAVLERSRGGAAFSSVGITQPTFAKGDGRVYCSFQFATAEWAVGDLYRLTVSGITCLIGAVTVYVPIQVWSNVITDLITLKAVADTINTNVGDASVHTLTSLVLKLGDLTIDLDTLLGARWDGGGDLGTDILALLTNIGDPSGETLTSLTAKLGDLTVSLDTLLGARWDAGGDLGTDIAALLANLGDASADTLTSVVLKLGDFARDLYTVLGTRWDAAGDLGTDIAALLAGGVASLVEQADVNISDVTGVAPAVFNIFNLAAANTRYVVRSLRIKCVDPTPNTITVRLWELINGALTDVDQFVIDGTNFGNHHSLMDMFGLPQLSGDQLKVTIEASAVGYAVLAQYSYAKATI